MDWLRDSLTIIGALTVASFVGWAAFTIADYFDQRIRAENLAGLPGNFETVRLAKDTPGHIVGSVGTPVNVRAGRYSLVRTDGDRLGWVTIFVEDYSCDVAVPRRALTRNHVTALHTIPTSEVFDWERDDSGDTCRYDADADGGTTGH
jgi:hypothetical protein